MSWAPSTQETLSLKYFSTNNKIATYNKIIASRSSYPPVMAVLPLQILKRQEIEGLIHRNLLKRKNVNIDYLYV